MDNTTNEVISVHGDISYIPAHHAADDYDMIRQSVHEVKDSLKEASGILLGLLLSIPLWALLIWGLVKLIK